MGEAEFKPNGITIAVGEAMSEMAVASGEMRLVTLGGRY